MPTEEDINNALLAIHSRLGVIEGKVSLVARAHKDQNLSEIEAAVRNKPLLGQIYLLLDGSRSQTDIHEELTEFGIITSAMGVSRAMKDLETQYGMADLVSATGSKVFRKDPGSERVLNLSVKIRKWLVEEGKTIPERPQRCRGKKDR